MKVIIIEGGIGVGKSTLLSSLEKLDPENIGVVQEIVPKDKLKLFLEGRMDAHAFQLIMACKRLVAQNLALRAEKAKKYVFMERSVFSDYCFAKCAIKDMADLRDYETFAQSTLWKAAVKPDLTIYLKGSLDKQTERIKERGRPGEQWYLTEEGITYRKRLNFQHDTMFNFVGNTNPVLTLNPDKLDWRNETVVKEIFEVIERELSERVMAS